MSTVMNGGETSMAMSQSIGPFDPQGSGNPFISSSSCNETTDLEKEELNKAAGSFFSGNESNNPSHFSQQLTKPDSGFISPACNSSSKSSDEERKDGEDDSFESERAHGLLKENNMELLMNKDESISKEVQPGVVRNGDLSTTAIERQDSISSGEREDYDSDSSSLGDNEQVQNGGGHTSDSDNDGGFTYMKRQDQVNELLSDVCNEQCDNTSESSGPSSVIIASQEVPCPDQAAFILKSGSSIPDLPSPQKPVVEILPETITSASSPILEEEDFEDENSVSFGSTIKSSTTESMDDKSSSTQEVQPPRYHELSEEPSLVSFVDSPMYGDDFVLKTNSNDITVSSVSSETKKSLETSLTQQKLVDEPPCQESSEKECQIGEIIETLVSTEHEFDRTSDVTIECPDKLLNTGEKSSVSAEDSNIQDEADNRAINFDVAVDPSSPFVIGNVNYDEQETKLKKDLLEGPIIESENVNSVPIQNNLDADESHGLCNEDKEGSLSQKNKLLAESFSNQEKLVGASLPNEDTLNHEMPTNITDKPVLLCNIELNKNIKKTIDTQSPSVNSEKNEHLLDLKTIGDKTDSLVNVSSDTMPSNLKENDQNSPLSKNSYLESDNDFNASMEKNEQVITDISHKASENNSTTEKTEATVLEENCDDVSKNEQTPMVSTEDFGDLAQEKDTVETVKDNVELVENSDLTPNGDTKVMEEDSSESTEDDVKLAKNSSDKSTKDGTKQQTEDSVKPSEDDAKILSGNIKPAGINDTEIVNEPPMVEKKIKVCGLNCSGPESHSCKETTPKGSKGQISKSMSVKAIQPKKVSSRTSALTSQKPASSTSVKKTTTTTTQLSSNGNSSKSSSRPSTSSLVSSKTSRATSKLSSSRPSSSPSSASSKTSPTKRVTSSSMLKSSTSKTSSSGLKTAEEKKPTTKTVPARPVSSKPVSAKATSSKPVVKQTSTSIARTSKPLVSSSISSRSSVTSTTSRVTPKSAVTKVPPAKPSVPKVESRVAAARAAASRPHLRTATKKATAPSSSNDKPKSANGLANGKASLKGGSTAV